MSSTAALRHDRTYLLGCGLVLLAGLVLSLGVFCIRGTGGSDAWQYLFWRAIGFTAALAMFAAIRQRINPVEQVRRLGRLDAGRVALRECAAALAAALTRA